PGRVEGDVNGLIGQQGRSAEEDSRPVRADAEGWGHSFFEIPVAIAMRDERWAGLNAEPIEIGRGPIQGAGGQDVTRIDFDGSFDNRGAIAGDDCAADQRRSDAIPNG